MAGVALEHPSGTTNYLVNPSYRIYYIKDHELIDYSQYRLNITEANLSDNPKWKLAYSFREYYNVTNMTDKMFYSLAAKIRVLYYNV